MKSQSPLRENWLSASLSWALLCLLCFCYVGGRDVKALLVVDALGAQFAGKRDHHRAGADAGLARAEIAALFDIALASPPRFIFAIIRHTQSGVKNCPAHLLASSSS